MVHQESQHQMVKISHVFVIDDKKQSGEEIVLAHGGRVANPKDRFPFMYDETFVG